MKSKYEIVKFKNGSYAVRVIQSSFMGRIKTTKYVSLINSKVLWSLTGEYFTHCQGSLEAAQKLFDRLTDEGEVVQ